MTIMPGDAAVGGRVPTVTRCSHRRRPGLSSKLRLTLIMDADRLTLFCKVVYNRRSRLKKTHLPTVGEAS